MEDQRLSDWDPRSEAVQRDQIAAYDTMRRRCPVAYSDPLQWAVFRHADVLRVLEDHETFSSVVSPRVSVPNGMDPPDHTAFRRIVEPYFDAAAVAAFEPICAGIARELAGELPAAGDVELMAGFARPFALRIQCAFMGWPDTLYEPLQAWMRRNHEATLAGDRAAMVDVAQEFERHMLALLDERRQAGAAAPDDVTTRLLRGRVDGRPLSDPELISMLRNWTVGELGTIAAAVGILAHYLAHRPDVQMQLREQSALIPAAIDEILRIHAPLIANRRITTRPVELGGRRLAAGERLSIIWASANRDEAVFGDPDEFRLDRDPKLNLLYGAGIHVCPGAPLARLELRLALQALLARTRHIAPVPDQPPRRAVYPGSGFDSLMIRCRAGKPG